MLMAAEPETFLLHDHYTKHGLILVAAGRIDRDWAEARLRRTWRDLAPKRWFVKFGAGDVRHAGALHLSGHAHGLRLWGATDRHRVGD